MNVWAKRYFSYFLSLSLVTVIQVYILDIPTFISQAPDLVNEYYRKNAISSFIFDFFLLLIYFSVGMYFADFLNINKNDNAGQLLALIISSMTISGAFMVYFLSRKVSKSFFSRWFHRIGVKAVFYDVILVSSVYTLMMLIHQKIYRK
jgi:hypothetical protein